MQRGSKNFAGLSLQPEGVNLSWPMPRFVWNFSQTARRFVPRRRQWRVERWAKKSPVWESPAGPSNDKNESL